MSNFTHTFLDAETGKTLIVDFTEKEIEEHNKKIAADEEAATTRIAAKAALLERLGITADEAALLLG